MEAYLSRTMWGILEKYPEKYNDLGKGIGDSVRLNNLFTKGIPKFIKDIALKNMQFHNLAQVKVHYKNAFEIEFPKNISILLEAVKTRHDIVHRCGFSEKNKKSDITFTKVENLKQNIIDFIEDIDNQIIKKYFNDNE